MDILSEIIEASNHMIDALEENDFFLENPFLEQIPLKRALQIRMQQKWEQDAKIKVLSRETGKVIKTLTPEEFNFYIASPGKFLSFEEFEDPEILRQGKFISGVIKKLLSYHRRKIPVAIVTARSNTKLVRDFFAERGINIHKDLVIAVNDPSQGLTGSIAERKLEALRRLYEMGLEHFTFFDDNEDNLRLAKELEKTGADVELVKVEGEVPRKFRG
jgi:hypothetical protein